MEMERKKKGLFGRLLDFWREGLWEGAGGGIGFWTGRAAGQAAMTEAHTVPFSPKRGEEKRTFWEETADTAEQERQAESLLAGGRRLAAEERAQERARKERLSMLTAGRRKAERGTAAVLTAVMFREKPQAEEGRPIFLQGLPLAEEERRKAVFLQEPPLAEKESEKENRKIVPVAARREPPEGMAQAEVQERAQATAREEGQERAAEIDIEGLMREMTKRLWEEREGCGRRLRR